MCWCVYEEREGAGGGDAASGSAVVILRVAQEGEQRDGEKEQGGFFGRKLLGGTLSAMWVRYVQRLCCCVNILAGSVFSQEKNSAENHLVWIFLDDIVFVSLEEFVICQGRRQCCTVRH